MLTPRIKKILRTPRYLFELIIAFFMYLFFWLLPIERASYCGGLLARKIGPFFSASKVAYRNLGFIFPKKTEQEKREIINQMWDNLGRIIGELPHWPFMSESEIYSRVVIKKNFDIMPKNGAIFVSGHFGNFELSPMILKLNSDNFNIVYRPANNPFVNALINFGRHRYGGKLLTKGMLGVRQIVSALNNNGFVGMLVDQKTNEGINAKFLGQDSKTTALPAKFALKYNAAIIVGVIRRTKGANYEVNLKELQIDKSKNYIQLTEEMNDYLGEWIMKYPSQWFWVHKRWHY